MPDYRNVAHKQQFVFIREHLFGLCVYTLLINCDFFELSLRRYVHSYLQN